MSTYGSSIRYGEADAAAPVEPVATFGGGESFGSGSTYAVPTVTKTARVVAAGIGGARVVPTVVHPVKPKPTKPPRGH